MFWRWVYWCIVVNVCFGVFDYNVLFLIICLCMKFNEFFIFYVKIGCFYCSEVMMFFGEYGIGFCQVNVIDDVIVFVEMEKKFRQMKVFMFDWYGKIFVDFGIEEFVFFFCVRNVKFEDS